MSIVYTIYVILSALADTDTFGQPMGVVYLTSKYNATIILYTYYLILFIATITTICDFVIYRINKTFKKRFYNRLMLSPLPVALSTPSPLRAIHRK